MPRTPRAVGALAGCVGAGLAVPVVVEWMQHGALTGVAVILLVASGCLLAFGVATVLAAVRTVRHAGMPDGVRAAVAANILVLAFLALELSDRLVRQDGRIFYWTTFLLPPALVLFYGLLTGRSWAWWSVRVGAALGVLLLVGFLGLIPFADLRADGVPAPWYGRVYMAVVSLAFAGVLAAAWWALGRPVSRDYFRLDSPGPK